MITPFDAIKPAQPTTYLLIEQPQNRGEQAKVPVKFNPSEYQIQKQNNFADIEIPGLETPPIQFVRGAGEKLTTELLVDTSDTLEDVREKYVNRIRGLMNIQSELHAPPIVQLVWGPTMFRGVIDSLSITYVLFRPDGVPLRAKLSLSLKEYRPIAIQVKETPRNSPDVDKSYVVRRGESLSSIAHRVYRDNSVWRDIARANGIHDPRRLVPGTVLSLPKLK